MTDTRKPKRDLPPVIDQANPETELEEELRSNPSNADTKVDVGSDESMDASDPSSAVQPAHEEPAPSSGSPDDEDD